MVTAPVLVLASASPRRRELLASVGLRVGGEMLVDPADTDESWLPGEDPLGYVARVAADKAAVVARRPPGRVVLAAATPVGFTLYVLGGSADGRTPVADAEGFRAFDRWSRLPAMPTARAGLSAVSGPAARVLAIGGRSGDA
ncbi:MAG: Maf family protein, partial [Ilumatobacteraceae bacterium]